jgi:hypothetical protein
MVAMKTKINIQLDVLDTTKQLGTRIAAKEMKTPNEQSPSTDVLARCGITTSMSNTMIGRGLKSGDISITDMTVILKSIVLSTLTFGLAKADLNQLDQRKLRTAMAVTTHAVTGLPPGRDPTETWAALELGITDPVDQIAITDWTTVAKMVEGKANPLATEVVLNDSSLKIALEATKQEWNFKTNHLVVTPPKMRHAWLKRKARARRIAQANGTPFDPEGTPFWENSQLQPKYIGLAMQYRCMIAQSQIRTLKHCVMCNTTHIAEPTIVHFLQHCTHGAEVSQDPARTLALSAQDIAAWKALDKQGVSGLCARPHHREKLLSLVLDTLHHCRLFALPYNIINTSNTP